MVTVCGFMQLWGLTIDIVSCIGLTLAIGLCVDYAAHIAYSFISTSEPTRQERVLSTMGNIGFAVLNGGLSTILALSMLSQSDAYTFQAFFKVNNIVIYLSPLLAHEYFFVADILFSSCVWTILWNCIFTCDFKLYRTQTISNP